MAPQPQNWDTIKGLFAAALELDPADRPEFLLKNSHDLLVRAEVERLLAEHEQAGSFLSAPALGNCNPEAEPQNRRFQSGELLAGRFKIVRFIAAGGMGEVYEAEDLELREHVAVKTILPGILREPTAASRFKREIHLARRVTHPNVCRIFDLFRHAPDQGDEETLFVSMELLNGKTLAEQLETNGRITMQEALPLVTQMASALSAAHDVGIVHRDFKPGNVVLVPAKQETQNVRVVVTDFGLASRSLSSVVDFSTTTLTTENDLSGTPAYMAPEQIEGHPATPASDIYALGLVIYEMVTGQRPFHGDNPRSAALKRLSVAPPPPRVLVPELTSVWERVILRCLEREPAKRFTEAHDVSVALTVESSAGNSATPEERSSVTKESPGIEQQTRVLEAAAPEESTVGRSTEVVAMVRRTDSDGLREYLNQEALSTVTPEDVREKPFELEFAVDALGKVQPAEICLRLDSPDFQPPSQTKKLRVPPRGNSPLCTFLIRPTIAGELIANLELLKGEETVVSRRIKTRAIVEGSPVGSGVNIVSIPITILVQDSSGDLFRFVGAAQSSSTKPSQPLSPECPPQKAVGEFTEMFWVPQPPEGSPSKPAAYTQILSVSELKNHLSPDTKALTPATDAGQRAMPVGGDTHVGRRKPATSSYLSRWKKLMLTAGAIVFSVIAVLFGVQHRGLRIPRAVVQRPQESIKASSPGPPDLGLPPFPPEGKFVDPSIMRALTPNTWRRMWSSRSRSAQQCGVDFGRQPKRIFAAPDKKSWREYKPTDANKLGWRRSEYAVLWDGHDGNLLVRTAIPGKDFTASTEYCFDKAGQLVHLTFVRWTESGWGYYQEGPIVNGAIATEMSVFFSERPMAQLYNKPEQADAPKPRLYLMKSELPFSRMLPR
jgi:serine/threonine protein kinase